MAEIFKGTDGDDRIYLYNEFYIYGLKITAYGYGGNDVFSASLTACVTIYGGGGSDSIRYGGGAGSVFHGGTGADILDGFLAGFSAFYGDAGNDRLIAHDEGMLLDGGAGADTMTGGDGADTFVVGSVRDTISETFVREFDNIANPHNLVKASLSWRLGARLEDLTLTGSLRVNGTGNAQANILTGNDERNVLSGLAGGDTLCGMGGSDRLIGGDGNDRFVFLPSDATRQYVDTIAGFDRAGGGHGDHIDVRKLDADLTTLKNDAFHFGSTGKGGISLTNDGADTLIQFNMDGDRAFEWTIRIGDGSTRASAYSAEDFLL